MDVHRLVRQPYRIGTIAPVARAFVALSIALLLFGCPVMDSGPTDSGPTDSGPTDSEPPSDPTITEITTADGQATISWSNPATPATPTCRCSDQLAGGTGWRFQHPSGGRHPYPTHGNRLDQPHRSI